MDGDTLYSIGDLARRTGLPVKVIRFYSDRGIVPPTTRTPAGYRLYDRAAAARLDLVRTLRALGLGLPAIRGVVNQELTLPEVAATHAEALAVQIRLLRLQHAVLTAVARREAGPEEMDLMHRLARLSEQERRDLIAAFLDAAFTPRREFEGIRRTMTPELPADPTSAQLDAWVELAQLSQDPGFRTTMRHLADHFRPPVPREDFVAVPREDVHGIPREDIPAVPCAVAAARVRSSAPAIRRPTVAAVLDEVTPALSAGVDPASPEAAPVVAAFTAEHARTCGTEDGPALRRRLLTHLETANDPRRERYFRLLAVINDWLPPDSLTLALDWSIRALRAHPIPG
ncbi:MerR family transcriptional regulator [Sphaerisporangium aureirubrum]|uniref:MerR family transcriptional regulator n=1 Tax=Sphaerisporangium aureirubrum TaxID=1544736 RepID=A0ABW1NRY1_9ACTN